MTKNTILKFILLILTLVISFFAWRSVDAAINVVDASVWLAPTIWFSSFFIIFSLSVILIKEFYLVAILAIFSLLLSMLFVTSIGQLGVIIFGFLFVLLAANRIKKDLQLNIRLSLWKTIRTGSSVIIFSLGLIISGQYYFTVKDSSADKLIPKFKMQGLSSAMTSNILKTMNPDFKNLSDGDMTVDQLILQTQKNQIQDQEMPAQFSGQIDQIALSEGRKQLAQMTGAEITGQEKVADLFSETINNKINSYIVPNLVNNQDFPILPIIMTLILFLTVVPLGSFLSPLLILIASGIFMLLAKLGVVSISKVMKEVEVLE